MPRRIIQSKKPILIEELSKARGHLELAEEALYNMEKHQSKAINIIFDLNEKIKNKLLETTPLESKCIKFIDKSIDNCMDEISDSKKHTMTDTDLIYRIQEYLNEFIEHGNLEECEESS
jgi:hypothetical protein